jgi:hypothetical protein
MRPVSNEHETSQNFGDGATAGVAASTNPNSGMGYYVHLYGNYQPYGHAGMDIACPVGTPIYAPADGTVLYSGWTEDLPGSGEIRKWLFYYNFGGILTVIQHDGWISAIAHQSDNDVVSVGMHVKEGQLIGKSGDTKTRTTKVAPHVHAEALVYMDYRTDVRNGIIYGRVDPQQFFGGLAAAGTITPQSSTESEEDFMGGMIDAQQADDIARAAAKYVFELMDNKVRINALQAESIVQATTARTTDAVDARNTGKTIDRGQADDIARAAANYSK